MNNQNKKFKDIELIKNNSTIEGLKWIPSLGIMEDELDYWKIEYSTKNVAGEFTANDQEKLKEYFLQIKDKTKCIVEIGVNRNIFEKTSTYILLNNKLNDTIYIGVDIEDKSSLNNIEKNIHTLKINSRSRDEVYNKMKELGVDKIDFLFIDGWHSINMVVNDWRYTKKLSDFGIVGFHDTSVHPGPYFVFDAVDESMYTKVKYFEDRNDDWGISFAIKK